MSRTHVIHANNGNGKPLCNVKKWKCIEPVGSNKNVECKFCLKKLNANCEGDEK